jgi:UDP-2-acetamido-3-amino-2,3-dideoxy-glucuronate N-acetyltransferase
MRSMASEHSTLIHPTADVSPKAQIGPGTKVWQHCQVREEVVIGHNCILSKGVYVDAGVHIGNHVKIQNGISIYHGVTLEDGVFCGPHCVFTNDRQPRAINPDGSLKSFDDWQLSQTLVCVGASIGAHATIICGVTIGRWAMVGAGAVVTRDVPDHGLVYGNPARLHGFVCPCGEKLALEQGVPDHPWRPGTDRHEQPTLIPLVCPKCDRQIGIPEPEYNLLTKS